MRKTYAIGDIHGEAGLFQTLLDQIAQDANGADHRIITLGDYCDRGPDSKAVYDILMSRPEIIALRGNHEDLLLQALSGRFDDVRNFFGNGGDATVRSFGGTDLSIIPKPYLDFIRQRTQFFFEDDLRWFVHAGVRPKLVNMTQQSEHDLLWMREPFLGWTGPFPKYVVHGHTPRHAGKPEIDQAEVRANRCNLDTGAFHSGVLTAGVFDDHQPKPIGFLTAGARRH